MYHRAAKRSDQRGSSISRAQVPEMMLSLTGSGLERISVLGRSLTQVVEPGSSMVFLVENILRNLQAEEESSDLQLPETILKDKAVKFLRESGLVRSDDYLEDIGQNILKFLKFLRDTGLTRERVMLVY
ncbi:hypothetical protein EG329_004521 [Mollisiaceae sp. DMI_Dod_QoI]|nr:hypothetical protein EG329_004521 [Helotiales sp. DMI_Dod_QoI]